MLKVQCCCCLKSYHEHDISYLEFIQSKNHAEIICKECFDTIDALINDMKGDKFEWIDDANGERDCDPFAV